MSSVSKIKDNFIDLIKNFPDDWELSKNKYAFLKITNGKNMSETTDVLSLTINGIQIKKDLTFGKTSKSYIGHQLVKVGDLVFTPRDFDQTPILSDVSKHDGCISNLYIVDKPNNEFLPEYINYFWHGLKYSFDYFKNFSYGIRFSFNREQFDEIPILKPSLNEQKLISRYLDKKTSQIDSLIEKLKKRANFIKEGILNHYYECEIRKTSLNPHPTCWFQRIPEDWDILKFRQMFEPVSIKNNSTDERLLSVTQDKGVVFRDEQERDVVNPGGDTSSYKLVTPGDVIISLRSADGGLEVSDVRGLVSPAYIVLKPKFNYDRNFYRYLLTSENFVIELNRYIKGIRDGKNIYFDDIKDVLIPYFPIHRQNEPYQRVVSHHENLVKSFSLIEKKITYLNEYRQSVISSVVTGKIRVTEDMI